MLRFRVSSLVLAVPLLAASLFAQQPSSEPLGKHPDVAANPGVDNMYVPPIAGQPFSGKSVVTVSRNGSSSHLIFMSMLARDSKGKLYFENRRPIDETGQPQPNRHARSRSCRAMSRMPIILRFRRTTRSSTTRPARSDPHPRNNGSARGLDRCDGFRVCGKSRRDNSSGAKAQFTGRHLCRG
jgi:hypothetical protein